MRSICPPPGGSRPGSFRQGLHAGGPVPTSPGRAHARRHRGPEPVVNAGSCDRCRRCRNPGTTPSAHSRADDLCPLARRRGAELEVDHIGSQPDGGARGTYDGSALSADLTERSGPPHGGRPGRGPTPWPRRPTASSAPAAAGTGRAPVHAGGGPDDGGPQPLHIESSERSQTMWTSTPRSSSPTALAITKVSDGSEAGTTHTTLIAPLPMRPRSPKGLGTTRSVDRGGTRRGCAASGCAHASTELPVGGEGDQRPSDLVGAPYGDDEAVVPVGKASRIPAASVVMTGRPDAMASSTTLEIPSAELVCRNTSARRSMGDPIGRESAPEQRDPVAQSEIVHGVANVLQVADRRRPRRT